ncbi:MAG: ACT domain-containing protein [Actinomycetota bacterium]|nr:ACT domain-containing protein [Actinomycetota bacterium]
MPSYVVRVWLPDRPGALGAVASRMGSVGGDVVAIEVLERGGGHAVDDMRVNLPSEDLVPLLLAEVHEVDGVRVENISAAPVPSRDVRIALLGSAYAIMSQQASSDVFRELLAGASELLECDWMAVVACELEVIVAHQGDPPPEGWLEAFAMGVSASAEAEFSPSGFGRSPEGLAWALLERTRHMVVGGREGRPFLFREAEVLDGLARIADHRLEEAAGRDDVVNCNGDSGLVGGVAISS